MSGSKFLQPPSWPGIGRRSEALGHFAGHHSWTIHIHIMLRLYSEAHHPGNRPKKLWQTKRAKHFFDLL